MVKVKIFIEGGGKDRFLKKSLKEGFHKLFEKTGELKNNPMIISGGDRNRTFKYFKNAIASKSEDEIPILLVDSEEPLEAYGKELDSSSIWNHLKKRDNWQKPQEANNDQVALMATCMESWLVTDRKALKDFFGQHLLESRLPSLDQSLEKRNRHEIQDSLVKATEACGFDRKYKKGERSFKLLSYVDPKEIKKFCPQFNRFIEIPKKHLG